MNRKMSSTRLAAGEAILELAREGLDLVAVSADTSKSMYTSLLKQEFPDRFVDTGIAEQNMMMVAAGLAATGKIAFAASYSVFTSMRCCEQLRTFVAYPNLNVKVIAGIGGLSAGIEGATHTATEDLGIMRCIANIAVLAPSDAIATRKAVRAAASYQGPVYIRVGREATPVLFEEDYIFDIGKVVVHKKGADLTLIATGLVLSEVFDAAEILEKEGIRSSIIEVHTLKPCLNPEVMMQDVLSTGHVITIEEHNVIGGLGTLVSEIMAGAGVFRMTKLGLPDIFAESGTPDELRAEYKLNAASIASEARKLLGAYR
jgi:transketolase